MSEHDATYYERQFNDRQPSKPFVPWEKEAALPETKFAVYVIAVEDTLDDFTKLMDVPKLSWSTVADGLAETQADDLVDALASYNIADFNVDELMRIVPSHDGFRE